LKNGIWNGRVVGMANQPEIVAVLNGDEVLGLEVQATEKRRLDTAGPCTFGDTFR
jgi:hypothetical protein|tara:strand:+ start:790 stop:954 length:165 start_codon:yes stop_codon:yes gene_type:complete